MTTDVRVSFIALNAYGKVGGIQRFNQRVIEAISCASKPTVFLLSDDPDDLPESYRSISQAFSGNKLRMIFSVFLHIRSRDVLLIGHINLLIVALICRILNPKLKLVLFVHGVDVWGEAPYRTPKMLDRFILRWVDLIASVSQFTARKMAASYGVSMSKFSILPNAVDEPCEIEFQKPRQGKPSFLCVSRLAETERDKNIDKVIQAMKIVCRSSDDITLNIVGEGALVEELRQLSIDCGVDKNVSFLGRVSDQELAELYYNTSALVLPSSKEGFGIVYLEAWGRGVPVIGSIYGAGPEVIEDGIQGFTVDPSDIETLADRMLELSSDEELNREMGAAGLKKVLDMYLQGHFSDNVHEIIRSVKS